MTFRSYISDKTEEIAQSKAREPDIEHALFNDNFSLMKI